MAWKSKHTLQDNYEIKLIIKETKEIQPEARIKLFSKEETKIQYYRI